MIIMIDSFLTDDFKGRTLTTTKKSWDAFFCETKEFRKLVFTLSKESMKITVHIIGHKKVPAINDGWI